MRMSDGLEPGPAEVFLDALRAVSPIEWCRLRDLPPLVVWRYTHEKDAAVSALASALASFEGAVAWEWGRHPRSTKLGGTNWWLTLREVGELQRRYQLPTDSAAAARLADERPDYVVTAREELLTFADHVTAHLRAGG